MTLEDAYKTLGIEEYAERIFNSNSHGELFHIMEYKILALTVKEFNCKYNFASWFREVVEDAEKNWERPESVFQHIPKMFTDRLRAQLIKGEPT